MQNSMGVGLDRMICQMRKKVKGFGAKFGVLKKVITEKQNG